MPFRANLCYTVFINNTRAFSAQKEHIIKLSETPRKKKIIIRIVLIILLTILLTAAVIGVVLMVRSFRAGSSVAFLSDVNGLKDNYYVGDEEETGGTLRATYKDGRVEIVPITEDMVEGFDSSEPGLGEITITYKEASIDVPLTFLPLKVRSIAIDEATRPTVVYRGVAFPTGMYIDVEMIDDTRRHVPVTNSMIKGYDEYRIGTQKITVTYMNASVSLTVEVKEDEIDHIEVLTEKAHYALGEEPSIDALQLVIVNKSGMTRTLKVTQAMLSEAIDTSSVGEKALTVTYSDFSTEYEYTVS